MPKVKVEREIAGDQKKVFKAVKKYLEGRDTLKESDVVVYSRRTYIGRGHKEMGCVITGVV